MKKMIPHFDLNLADSSQADFPRQITAGAEKALGLSIAPKDKVEVSSATLELVSD